ncbi:hypothetical protein FB471_3989 [Amycolatopsis cihanbeyliensis]|uniref:Uncharacterized protein n=1 Tax=Amycolatopsis cihanbeyliensis TaxID=1128664 RepID=A0A542DM81_AMYCI|nr:hypothetical protein FB471_3989 [Amycolatopsis cihanbeyliensis]
MLETPARPVPGVAQLWQAIETGAGLAVGDLVDERGRFGAEPVRTCLLPVRTASAVELCGLAGDDVVHRLVVGRAEHDGLATPPGIRHDRGRRLVLPVPGGPVTTVSGLLAAMDTTCSRAWLSRNGQASNGAAGGGEQSWKRKRAALACQPSARTIQSRSCTRLRTAISSLPRKSHDQVEHAELLRPPQILLIRWWRQAERVEHGVRDAQRGEQLLGDRCHRGGRAEPDQLAGDHLGGIGQYVGVEPFRAEQGCVHTGQLVVDRYVGILAGGDSGSFKTRMNSGARCGRCRLSRTTTVGQPYQTRSRSPSSSNRAHTDSGAGSR